VPRGAGGKKAVENTTERLREEVQRPAGEGEHRDRLAHPRGTTSLLLTLSKAGRAGTKASRAGDIPTLDKVPGATPAELRLTLQPREVARIQELAVRQKP